MPLTTLLLTQNNEKTIENTLKSVKKHGRVVVGDIGSTDNTTLLCRRQGADVVEVPFSEDFSKAKNELSSRIQNDWVFWIEPWEILVSENFQKVMLEPAKLWSAQIMNGDIITKESRVWHASKGVKFSYPAYESVLESGTPSGILIYTAGGRDASVCEKIVDNWSKLRATDPQPVYYKACSLLAKKDFKGFVGMANSYLFMEKSGMSVVMMKYYLSSVLCHIVGDTENAIRHILSCIAVNPLMAEFWCLLGDVNCKVGQYERAMAFYENAIILGGRRLKDDPWPIEINKYRKYPEKMLGVCDSILRGTKVFVGPHQE